jgi:hypothetical protein
VGDVDCGGVARAPKQKHTFACNAYETGFIFIKINIFAAWRIAKRFDMNGCEWLFLSCRFF